MKKNITIVAGTMVAAAAAIAILYRWPMALGGLAAWVTTGSFFLQVLHIIRNKDTTGISLGMYAALFFGVTSWTAYGFNVQDIPVMTANGITALLALVVIVLKLYHEREIKPSRRRTIKVTPMPSRRRMPVADPLNKQQL